MANNSISWLGNPVVDGNSSGTSTRSTELYQPCLSQDSQALFPTEKEMAVYPQTQEGPPPITDINYIPGYLASNIGKNVRAEFTIGTQYIDKTGKLVDVGVNYFVLEDVNSRTNIMCDLYSVKFVTILV